MIRVKVRYPETERLMGVDEEIGFYEWEVFKAHFERIIRWQVPVEILEIKGHSEKYGQSLDSQRLIVCIADDCEVHDGNVIVIDRDIASRRDNTERFIEDLNLVIRRAANGLRKHDVRNIGRYSSRH